MRTHAFFAAVGSMRNADESFPTQRNNGIRGSRVDFDCRMETEVVGVLPFPVVNDLELGDTILVHTVFDGRTTEEDDTFPHQFGHMQKHPPAREEEGAGEWSPRGTGTKLCAGFRVVTVFLFYSMSPAAGRGH